MINKPSSDENPEIPQIPEYNYEDGLAEVCRRLDEYMTREQPRIAVIAINGSGIEVGKTQLRIDIEKYLRNHSREDATNHIWLCHDYPVIPPQLLEQFRQQGSNDRVFVFYYNEEGKFAVPEKFQHYKTVINRLFTDRHPSLQVDLWIAIQRPDKRFPTDTIPMGDLLITNQHAIDRPY